MYDAASREIVLEPSGGCHAYWSDLWRYRELLYILTWRDVLVRYKQTVIGVAWAIFRPLMTMIIFTFVFGNLANLKSNAAPYPILVFAAMLPWQFFANALSESSNSVVANSGILTKVYFPRILLPISAVMVSSVEFFISFVVLLVLMALFHVPLTLSLLWTPIFLLAALAASMGAGFWMAALNVKYRDFKFIVPFIVQMGTYISPVGFSSSIVPAKWRLVYSLNPMVGVIDGFRWAILGSEFHIYWTGFLLSISLTILLFLSGLWFFMRTENKFADVI